MEFKDQKGWDIHHSIEMLKDTDKGYSQMSGQGIKGCSTNKKKGKIEMEKYSYIYLLLVTSYIQLLSKLKYRKIIFRSHKMGV